MLTRTNGPILLVGGLDGGPVKSKDEVEYTIYFLSTGTKTARNVQICDRIPDHQAFIPNAFNALPPALGGLGGTDRGIAVLETGTSHSFTNIGGDDSAQFYPPGSVLPAACNGAIAQSEDNGAIVVNLGDLSQATGPVTPPSSYGFVRFRAKVK